MNCAMRMPRLLMSDNPGYHSPPRVSVRHVRTDDVVTDSVQPGLGLLLSRKGSAGTSTCDVHWRFIASCPSPSMTETTRHLGAAIARRPTVMSRIAEVLALDVGSGLVAPAPAIATRVTRNDVTGAPAKDNRPLRPPDLRVAQRQHLAPPEVVHILCHHLW